ncbi:uncharacterized protein LOC114463824 [Gouania willdenowi]|uniref:uncharacterized protein LOC114463824 n=1 Tax=Gouania willdenowi TaxID=441366 RepID=UPI001055B043|nr:uncharacterized protein LOC114463824 [Gouania willdenowi]
MTSRMFTWTEEEDKQLCEEIWGGSASPIPNGVESSDFLTDTDCLSSGTRSSTPLPEIENTHQDSAGPSSSSQVFKPRRTMLQAKLQSHRGNRLKRKLHVDVDPVMENLKLQRRLVNIYEESVKQNAEELDRMTDNIAALTSSIKEEFSMLSNIIMSQHHPHTHTDVYQFPQFAGPPASYHYTAPAHHRRTPQDEESLQEDMLRL